MGNLDKKGDLRVRRTDKLLWDALTDLLSIPGKEFNSITVNEICEKAMVHRTTFYKHFKDKYDLLFFGFSKFNEEFIQISLEERIEQPFQSLEKMPSHELFDNIMQTQKNDAIFSHYIAQYNKEALKLLLIELAQRGKRFAVPIEIITEFYSGVLSSLSAWWARNGHRVSAMQMDQYFHELVNRDYFSL